MPQIRLTEMPSISILNTGSLAYIVDANQSYQGTIEQIALKLIAGYGLFSDPLTSSLMTSGNAEILLQGLNNAPNAVLDASRVDLSNAFFDVDGGTFFDTYVNTSTFDGGTI